MSQLLKRFKNTPSLLFAGLFFLLSLFLCMNAFVSKIILGRYHMGLQISVLQVLYGVFILLCFTVLLYAIFRYFRANESSLSLFNAVIKHRYLLALLFFLFALIFSLNGYSLSSWDRYVNTSSGTNILFGTTRDITSDTWALSLPMIFNQVDSGFPLYNTDIMTHGANALLLGLPVRDITMIAKPFMWGYLFFGKAVGASWYYFSRLFVMLLSSYEVCNYFSKRSTKLAALFAYIITFSPPMQWWFSQTIMDTFIFLQVCFVCEIFYMNNPTNLKLKVAAAAVICVAGSGYILVLYPALQVPLGYLFLIISAFLILENRKKIHLSMQDMYILLPALALTAFVVVRYFTLVWNDMRLLTATVYPGSRMLSGGGFDIQSIFYFFFQWILPIKNASMLNNCEVSMFVPFLPVVLLTFPFIIARERKWSHAVLYIYELFLISWLFIKYPQGFAKYTLFSYVTPTRLTLVIGLISVYLAVIAIRILLCSGRLGLPHTIGISLITVVLSVWATIFLDGGQYLQNLGSLKWFAIFVAIVFMSGFTFIICRANKKGILISLCAVIIFCGVTVAPLCTGLGPLYTSKLSQQITYIEKKDPNKLWVFNDSFPYSNYLIAQGVRCFNTLNPYPDYEKWKVIDPQGRYANIYNRYAHVSVTVINGETRLSLTAPDAIQVDLNQQALKKLGVAYIVSKQDINYFGYQKIYMDNESGFSVYQMIS